MLPQGVSNGELAQQEPDLNEARTKEQLASLMTHIAQMSLAVGAKAGAPDAKSQSTYENSTASTSNTGYGTSSGTRSSGHGSGSGGSGSGQGSGSGSGHGSGSGGSDGYCGDGSTGSGVENSSESSGNEDQTQNSRRLASMGMPMKIEVGSSLPSEHSPSVGKVNSTQHKAMGKFQETAGHQAGSKPLPEATPQICNLLEDVLAQVANTFPPEDAITVCSALANSLAGALVRNTNTPTAPGMPSAAVPPGMPPRAQAPDLEMILQELQRHQMQQELERQQQMQQLMTPPVLDMAHHVATLAAQHAASAWQQMQQTSSAPWQQDPMACIRDMSFPLQTPGTCDPRLMPPYFPGLPHQMGFTGDVHASHQMHFAGDVPLPTNISPLQPHLPPYAVNGSTGPHPYGSGSNGGSSGGGRKGTGRGKGANPVKSDARGKGGKTGPAGEKAEGKGSNKGAASMNAASPVQDGFGKSLRCNLEVLHELDCNRIVIVRKINRLGFESAQVLEHFFTKYGKVDRVLVSHSHAKSRNLRFRPSGLGFLVMTTAEEVQAVLADGPEIHVTTDTCKSVQINVQPFKRHLDLQNFDENEQS